MPAAPRLDRLPLELLQQIADYCDEKAVWRLSATSKWVRAGAELALRPFLKAQVIRASPPWVTDIYRHWDRKHAPTTTRPRDTLRPFLLNLANARFESHLYAHPSSASYLRELTVEILDCQPDAGWRYIIRFASQLTHVAIHMLDGQWTIPGPSGFGFGPWPDMFIGHALDRGQHIHGLEMSEIWPMPFRQAEVRFPKLTQLVLTTSARVFAHLAQFSTCCSDFTELVLSCHTRIYRGELQHLGGQKYNYLRYLTVTGHITIVNGALEAILGTTNSIAYLTIHLSPQQFASPIERILQVGAICVHKALLGLALYGPYAIGMLCSLQTWQMAYFGHTSLPNLAVLAFERPVEYPARFNNTHEYPRIYENKLDLPKLQRLVIVDIPFGWGPAPHQAEEVVYNNIFKPCRTFRRALRVTSYPKDPFAEDLESTRKIVLVDDDDPMC